MPGKRPYRLRKSYVIRILSSLTATLVLMIGLFQFWPTWEAAPQSITYSSRGDENIQLEEIQPTSHAQQKKPPPPAPLPPVVVPNDVIIEDEPLEFSDSSLPVENPEDDAVNQEGVAQATAAQRPDQNARLLRYVEPDYTRAARDEGIRARIVVEVKVDPQGRVQEASILERTLLSEEGTPVRTVSHLGYGLEEAALSAARRCLFRPARVDGKPVPTRTTLTISFGN